jgi:hypothetical protein
MDVTLTLIIVVAGLGLVWWLRHSRRQFRLVVREGTVTVTHGWLPGPMLADYRSALRQVRQAVVEGHREEGGLRVTGDLDDFTMQRLRNIARLYPVGAFRASTRSERKAMQATAVAGLTAAVTSSAHERDG